MLEYKPLFNCLPSAEDLPDSDDTPVDNELQDLIPGFLKTILAWIWASRMDWFFGVDMGVYYDPDLPPVVPDGFLSLGVRRIINENLRLSYLLWEEKVLPIMVLEVVSKKRRGEYTKKKDFYAKLGILYYVIYNPIRPNKPPLDVYRLVNGEYVKQKGNPVWLEEIGLGIGYERGTHLGITRDWLYWYDQQGVRYLTPEEQATTAEQRATTAEQRAKRLAEELRSLGIDPDTLN
ncbi:Uma2 family endonuclease [Scytonema sp. NUACC26]|uniref:Uma2 family endonuclease n=1 Tax=Scytonema sp. NUACC26 TaxID=3140176 RepID=UPI0034DC22D9